MNIGLFIWGACTACLLSVLVFKSGAPIWRAARSIFTASVVVALIAVHMIETQAAERRYGEHPAGALGAMRMTAEVDE